MTAIDLLFAPVLVLAVPLAMARLDSPWRLPVPAASAATTMLAVALFLAPSPVAVVLAAPWQVIAAAAAIGALIELARDRSAWHPSRRLAVTVALGFLAFGATNATSFAAGFRPLGFAPAIVLLTAVHFHTAGFVLMVAGIRAFDRRPSRIAALGVAGIAVGSTITAAGFVGVPVAAQLGALTVALGGLLLGWASVRVAPKLRTAWSRRLTTVAGLALFVSMPLAIAWAVAGALRIPFELDVMVRTHGAINALAVAIPLSIGWTLDARGPSR